MNIRPFSIKVIVSFFLVLISIADIGILGILIFRDSSRVLKTQLELYYNVTTQHLVEDLGNKFTMLENRLTEISQNTLLVNGLIDELGREQYLPYYIRGVTFPEFRSTVGLGLFDFELNAIESNNTQFLARSLRLIDIPALTRQVIEEGQHFRSFAKSQTGETFFIQAIPVFYEGNPEGVLLAVLNWHESWEYLTEGHEDLILAFNFQNREISSSGLKEEVEETVTIPIHALPEAVLVSSIPRSKIQDPIFGMARQMLIWGILLLVIMLIVSIFLVARKITQPIIRLQNAVSKISAGTWQTIRLTGSSREILDLAEKFNTMSSRLEKTQNELMLSYQQLETEKNKQLQSAYTAGMAENAIAVLHNIGNAITPIVVNLKQLNSDQSLYMIIKYTRKLYQTLKEKSEEGDLTHYLEHDEKGKQMLPFLGQLANQLEKQVAQKREYAEKADHQLQHIIETISLQKKYASTQSISEVFPIELVIGDVLEMVSPNTETRNIVINHETEPDLPMLKTDRNKLLQVLMNFLKNAIESIDLKLEKTPDIVPEIRISTRRGKEDRVEVAIRDNGIGASEETLEHAFEFGYSTKQQGSGFGLHDCANFVRANNGEISITSSGIGLGATIQFSLPILST